MEQVIVMTPQTLPLAQSILRCDNPMALSKQRGVSLLYAMLALVALSFAAAGLIRSASSGALVIGNLGFKTDTAAVTTIATEQAIAWLAARDDGLLRNDEPGSGYYAARRASLDATSQNVAVANRQVIDWNADDCTNVGGTFTDCAKTSVSTAAANNTKFSYVIMRLCANAGSSDVGNSCVTGLESFNLGDKSRDGLDYQNSKKPPVAPNTQPSYMILVRAVGGRNAVTFTETIVRK